MTKRKTTKYGNKFSLSIADGKRVERNSQSKFGKGGG